ncbi:hypothetical protein AM587_10012290 [Phytophthora nicotianae]|nr:hypothetical protein AM587_10012290 [Phytophthora nicotianae]
MHLLHSSLKLVLAVFLVFVLDRSYAASSANPLSASTRSVTESATTTKRFLRPGGGDNESRAANIPALEATIKGALPKLRNTEKLQLKWWLLQKKPLDKLLPILKLGNNVDDILTNPKLGVLRHYIAKFNKKYPGAPAATTVETLAKKYGEADVAKVLEVGKKSDTTRALATELQLEQFTVWLNQKLSPADVYKRLKLNNREISPFGTYVFEAWVGYLNKFNDKRLREKTPITFVLKELKAVYGERALASLLYQAKNMPDPMKTAESLQSKLYAQWRLKKVPEDKYFFIQVLKVTSSKATEMDKQIHSDYLAFLKANK